MLTDDGGDAAAPTLLTDAGGDAGGDGGGDAASDAGGDAASDAASVVGVDSRVDVADAGVYADCAADASTWGKNCRFRSCSCKY